MTGCYKPETGTQVSAHINKQKWLISRGMLLRETAIKQMKLVHNTKCC